MPCHLGITQKHLEAFLHVKIPCPKKQCCQVGHRAVKCSEHGEVGRNSNLSAPQSHDKNDWYSTTWTLNIKCKDGLRNSKLRQESLHVDWWPCVTLVYGLWPLETSKWTKPNITASLLSEARNQTVLSKKKILSSKNLSGFQHFWQLPYSMHTKETKMNAVKASKIFLWH